MTLSKVTGFLSYAHNDDEFGFLTNLQKDLCGEYRIVTGDELILFFDRNSIKWGSEWRKSIQDSIDTAGIFMPVISPCYLASEACMGELIQYLDKVEKTGARDLILPLLLVHPSVYRGKSDQMLEKLLSFQYKDIAEMRFTDRNSGAYCKYLNDLALGINSAQHELGKAALNAAPQLTDNSTVIVDTGSDEPDAYLLDAVNALPEKTEAVTEAISLIISDIDAVGRVFDEANGNLNPACTPKEALAIVTRLSGKLTPIVAGMLQSAEQFSLLVSDADPLIRLILGLGSAGHKDSDKVEISLNSLVVNAQDAKNGFAALQRAAREVEGFSRVLYKPLKTLERAAAICGNAIDVVISWGGFVPDAEIPDGGYSDDGQGS